MKSDLTGVLWIVLFAESLNRLEANVEPSMSLL